VKRQFSGFAISPGSAEALVRWGGKIEYLVIAYILSNIVPKIIKLECGPMPNVMAALPNIGDAHCSMPQSLADAKYWTAMQ